MGRQCPKCSRQMTLLFVSYVCDWCDGLKKPIAADHGFVIWADDGVPGPRALYVFPSKSMAEYYRRVSILEGEVRRVVSEAEVDWWMGEGSLRHLQRSRELFEIFPDYRFEPGPRRAFLVPEE